MAEDKVVEPAPGPYKESDEHVPDPQDVFGTLDTSGTAGGEHERLERVSPVFDAAKAQDLARAARAVDPDDLDVPESEVNVSSGVTVAQGDPEADRERVRKAAEALRENPVQVKDPALEEQSASSEDAQAQQQSTGLGGSSVGGTRGTAKGGPREGQAQAAAAKEAQPAAKE